VLVGNIQSQILYGNGVSMRYLCALSLLFLSVGVNAQKRFVYLNNQAQPNTITGWLINNSNGSLTQLSGSPFNTGGQGYQGPIESMAIDPTENGGFLYAANGGDPSVSILRINPGTGNLTPIGASPFLLNDGTGTFDMAISPNHRFLFVTNNSATVIHVLAVASENGSLKEVAGSPFPAGDSMSGLWVTANDKFLLAAGQTHNAVSVFAIASTGAIAPVPGSPFAANASVSDVRSNCASTLVFTADNGSGYIDAYSMAANGALTPVTGSPSTTGQRAMGRTASILPSHQVADLSSPPTASRPTSLLLSSARTARSPRRPARRTRLAVGSGAPLSPIWSTTFIPSASSTAA
jgi:6-phosphogluconolactonase (cycloisomerase 2 family)